MPAGVPGRVNRARRGEGLAARVRGCLALRLGPLLESPTKIGVLFGAPRVRLSSLLGGCLLRARALSLLSVKLANAQLLRSRILLHWVVIPSSAPQASAMPSRHRLAVFGSRALPPTASGRWGPGAVSLD